MLVCQCNQISAVQVEDAILDLLRQEPYQLIVPVQVYHSMKKRGQCCGCFPRIVETIVSVTERFHAQLQTPGAEIIDLVARLKEKNASFSASNGDVGQIRQSIKSA